MARTVASVIFLVVCAACMEMRETVERMVMVRTTGSDLQPAATGYIYKKGTDGPASVIQMGESEVMEHLSKLYEKPQAYKAHANVALGPVKEDESKEASEASESYIKPVVEKQEEDNEKVDGIADEDYGKMFDYAAHYDDYKKSFDDYLHRLGSFKDGLYKEQGGGKDYGSEGHHEYGDKGYKGFQIIHHYGKGGAGDYHAEKHASFASSEKGGKKKHHDEADEQGKEYAEGKGYKGGDHGHKESHSKGEEVKGYHNVYNKNVYKQDHDFYDKEDKKGGFYKHGDDYENHGNEKGGHEKGGSHKSGHNEGGYGKDEHIEKQSGENQSKEHSAESGGNSGLHKRGDFGAKGEDYGGKSYGYEVKH
ncbi:hypothetical protein O3G_MSEX003967 [Manduca sexta]|uniref:Uncharacterized protein n=1 Tax=Manduca sexta TaxID=7130 RepID=A0A921YUC5_MANSE|nr:hypothetical protein O3G_MSEX003967 [Manduca sexta]